MTMYFKIHLIDVNRIITAKPTSRGFLQDNSGIIYVDGTGTTCRGQLLLFDNQHAYAVILRFLLPIINLQGCCH